MHLASCYQGSEAEGGSQGCDISHRGGPPGFVQLQGEGTLFWADYIGNYTFTSLGAQVQQSVICIYNFACPCCYRCDHKFS